MSLNSDPDVTCVSLLLLHYLLQEPAARGVSDGTPHIPRTKAATQKQKKTYTGSENRVTDMEKRSQKENQPVIKTRGRSVSEKEAEWELAPAGTCGGEMPRNRTGRTVVLQLQAGATVLPTICLNILVTSICSSNPLQGKRAVVNY
jgi:hypothetical protein